ncbi:MAG: hypothetical protein PHD82_09870 [Candidatus Riflebacteria bacterium]|jgi:Tfp pilus assembly protein PilX|nr:hypothetical protein [Candidatus Riflebacteria bacterium]
MIEKCSNRPGVTLIEILVGFLITTIVGMTIYHFMAGARRLSAIAATKATLRQEALFVLKNLELDIANSRTETKVESGKNLVKRTLKSTGGSNFEMEVASKMIADNATFFDQSMADEDATFVKVQYQLQGSEYFRISGGTRKRLSSNVKEAKFEETADGGIDETYDGKVKLILTMEATPSGTKDKITHVERAIITLRQALAAEADPRWKQRIDANKADDY